MTKEHNIVLMSIIYQLLDQNDDISELNPFVQEYLQGLVDEINEMEVEEQDSLYFYADTFFNNLNKNMGVLH
jgi:hypothetical protein